MTEPAVRFSVNAEQVESEDRCRQLKRSVSIDPFDISCKVLLIGDSGVGKTCFLHQFKDNKFPGSTFISTVGVDYRSKTLAVDNFKVRFQVWDTAGTERYRSITSAYYRDADAILLFYDLTNRSSFTNVRSWLTDIREYGNEEAFILLVANKADLDEERQVSAPEGLRLAQENDIICFVETSAKTGYNVDYCHQSIGRRMLAKNNISNGRGNSGNRSGGPRLQLGSSSSSSGGATLSAGSNCFGRLCSYC